MMDVEDLLDVIKAKEIINEYESKRRDLFQNQEALYVALRMQAVNYLNNSSKSLEELEKCNHEYDEERGKISENLKKLEREIETINNAQIELARKITEFTENYEEIRTELISKQKLLREYEFLMEKSKRLNDDNIINAYVTKINSIKTEINELVYKLSCCGDKKLKKETSLEQPVELTNDYEVPVYTNIDELNDTSNTPNEEINNSGMEENNIEEHEAEIPIANEVETPVVEQEVITPSPVYFNGNETYIPVNNENEDKNIETTNSTDFFDVPTDEDLNKINESAFSDEEEHKVKNVREATPEEKVKFQEKKISIKSIALKSLIIVASALVLGPVAAVPAVLGYNFLAHKIKNGTWNPTERHLQVLKKDIESIMNIGKPKSEGGKVR